MTDMENALKVIRRQPFGCHRMSGGGERIEIIKSIHNVNDKINLLSILKKIGI